MSKRRIILMLVVAALVVAMMAASVVPAEAKKKTGPKPLPPKQTQACYQACTANGGAADASSEAFCAASCFCCPAARGSDSLNVLCAAIR